jgi:multidrug efflux system membrane fusion protein
MFNKNQSNDTERRMVPLRYVVMPFIIIFSAIVLLIIVSSLAPKPEKKPIVHKAPLVEVMGVTQQDITFVIESQGNIIPRTVTHLIAEVSGRVVDVSDRFKVGGYFAKGEQLLALNDIDYKIALIQAESNLASANANLIEEKARGEQAKSEWLMSGQSLDKAPVMALRTPNLQRAEADLKAAEATLVSAKIKLKRTKILAPYDAMIQEKNVDIGQFVSTGSSMAKTFAIDYAEARLPIKQRDVLFLDLPQIDQNNNAGALVDIQLEVGRDIAHWPAKLSRYEGVVDSKSRVHYVIAQIDDPYSLLTKTNQQELRMGSFINADIQGKRVEGVIAFPRDALHGANTIYTVDENSHLHIQKISLLRTDAEFAYSRDVLPPNHQLVITMLETPVEGMELRISGQQKSANKSSVEADKSSKNDDVIGEG